MGMGIGIGMSRCSNDWGEETSEWSEVEWNDVLRMCEQGTFYCPISMAIEIERWRSELGN